MDTSDLISRPALRRSPQSSEPLIRDESTRPSVFPAHIARGIAGFAALFSGVAWRATSDLTRTGFARLISHAAILGVTVGAIVISADATNSAQSSGIRGSQEVRNTALSAAPAAENQIADYPIYAAGGALLYQQSDIIRQADPYTIIPDRPRRGVEEYIVQPGDILFTIANRFGVSPETILWNNQDTLDNDPHRILPGTKLIIPPVSGIIHTVQEGDTLEGIAAAYKTTVDAIVVDGAQWNNLLDGRLPPAGSTLIVPGGQREFKGWEPPRTNRVSASGGAAPTLGMCADASGGLQGSGSFMWPANGHWVSGYNYSAWHPGLDLVGRAGDPVYAADNGFVVYAGWSNVGYGNLIVIDHGNGWQTWYAHLSLAYVACGQNVWQGSTIGGIGSTGNSSGPHLHFETRYQGGLPNPFNVLPAP